MQAGQFQFCSGAASVGTCVSDPFVGSFWNTRKCSNSSNEPHTCASVRTIPMHESDVPTGGLWFSCCCCTQNRAPFPEASTHLQLARAGVPPSCCREPRSVGRTQPAPRNLMICVPAYSLAGSGLWALIAAGRPAGVLRTLQFDLYLTALKRRVMMSRSSEKNLIIPWRVSDVRVY